MPAGIVDVKIRAFTPDDALAIGRAALEISETLINDLNDRMNRDALANAESEVERASARLAQSRLALETARGSFVQALDVRSHELVVRFRTGTGDQRFLRILRLGDGQTPGRKRQGDGLSLPLTTGGGEHGQLSRGCALRVSACRMTPPPRHTSPS
jgi:hypothetical protein